MKGKQREQGGKGTAPAGAMQGQRRLERAEWAMHIRPCTRLCAPHSLAGRKVLRAGKEGEDTAAEGPQKFLQQMYL